MQYAFNTLWSVPIVDRPRFPFSCPPVFALLCCGHGGCIGCRCIARRRVGEAAWGWPSRIVLTVVWAALDIGLFLATFRTATAKTVATRNLILGAVLSGLAWLLLLNVAGLVIEHYLRRAQALAGLFGIVLGLLAWFAIQATAVVIAVEADVVRAKKLWPRSLTDTDPTDADKQVLSLIANTQVRHPNQRIDVHFDD